MAKKPTKADITKVIKAHTALQKAFEEFKSKYNVSDSYIRGILKTSTKESI